MRTYLALLIFVLLNVPINAQNNCGTAHLLNEDITDGTINHSAKTSFAAAVNHWRNTHPGSHTLKSSYYNPGLTGSSSCVEVNHIIPVVIHIVHHPDSNIGQGENILATQIKNQLDSLNSAFRNDHGASINTGIQFALATKRPDGSTFTGIERHSSVRFHKIRYHKDSTNLVMQEYNYDDTRYLNIYVINEILDSSGSSVSIGGYAYSPQSINRRAQGIVMEHDKFGDYSVIGSPLVQGSEGKLLIHEVGHYLGLYHPWEGECKGSTHPDCKSKGDLCCDVAQGSSAHIECTSVNTCTDSTDNDAIHNYMCYTPDACKYKFTEDQLSIMLTVLAVHRQKLAQPTYVNTTIPDGCFWTARFTGNSVICTGDTAVYEAYNLGSSVSYTWKYSKIGGSSTTKIGSYKLSIPSLTIGEYEISLTVSSGGNSITYKLPNYLEVLDCKPLKSEHGNWLFGKQAGLHFYEGKVVRATKPNDNEPNIKSYEGSTSLSDSLGNLLFYVGGKSLDKEDHLKVFGSNFNPVINDSIDGSSSSAQSLIAIPFNSDSSKFHILSRGYVNDNSSILNIFNRNVVDVTKTGSFGEKGEIILANHIINDSNGNQIGQGEEISAIKRCDDSTYWVLTVDHDKDSLEFYIVSDTGVRFTHRQYVYLAPSSDFGFIKFSPDGQWVWIINSLYKFCRADGSLELVFNDTLNNNDKIYGISFSPNSQLFYVTGAKYDGVGDVVNDESYLNYLSQYNLSSFDIQSSRTFVAAFDELPLQDYFRAMQVAPDGKIYISAYGQTYLAVINQPNKRIKYGNECDFQAVGPALSVGNDGGISQVGLPNFIDARGPNDSVDGFSVRHKSCLGKEFVPATCCASSYKWLFGDGSSSLEAQPDHVYSSPGEYKVSLIIGTDTIDKDITVGIFGDDLDISGKEVICNDLVPYDYTAIADSNYTYYWNVVGGSGTVLGEENRISVNWNTNGFVKLIVQDINSGCRDSSELDVFIRDSIEIDFSFSNFNSCSRFEFKTLNYCDSSYSWNFGDGSTSTEQSPVHTYDSNGSYTVTLLIGSGSGADTISKTVEVGIGAQSLQIIGNGDNCDNTTLFRYFVVHDSNQVYSWSSTGTTSEQDSFYVYKAIWEQAGAIELIIHDSISGCRDTIEKIVTKSYSDPLDFSYVVSNCFEVQFESLEYCGLDRDWFFDDNGATSTAQNPTHTYSQTGTYSVRFVIDSDTVYKSISIGMGDLPKIVGDSVICDTLVKYTYSLAEKNEDYSYNWKIDSGTIDLVKHDTIAEVKFSGNSLINIVVANSVGCIDSISKSIEVHNPISNNIIQGDSMYFQPDSSSFILGNKPNGGTGNYSYQWFCSRNGTKYDSIIGATDTNLYLTDTMFRGKYYLRVVSSDQCEATSNVEWVAFVMNYNTISLQDTPCFWGDTATLLCSPYDIFFNNQQGGQGGLDNIYYTSNDSALWFIYDSTHNTAIPTEYLYSFVPTNETTYIYRRIEMDSFDAGFEHSTNSNVIKIEPKIIISNQPEDDYICDPQNDSWSFEIDIENNSGNSITITGQYKSEGGGTFTDIGTGDSISQVANLPPNYSDVDTFRFKIVTSCGTFYSNKALLKVSSNSPSLNTFINKQGNVGDSVFLRAIDNPTDMIFKWQETKYPNESTWSDIEGEETYYYYFKMFSKCEDSTLVRAIGTNGCGSDTTNASEISIPNNSDIWMKDDTSDTGTEPFAYSHYKQIVLSPDIINRVNNTSTFVHESPEYKQYSSNYVMVKVRNRGSDTTLNTPLYLYWTYASINGERWDQAWLNIPSNQYVNSSNDTFPMGSRINDTAINVPPIAPGDSVILSYPWYPPNPASYDSVDARINVCFLARLEECSVYPHKMAVDEEFGTHVITNVSNNNNIATKNMWVSDDVKGNTPGGTGTWSGWTMMGGYLPQDSATTDTVELEFKPCFYELSPDFFDFWDVYIIADNLLKSTLDSVLNENPHMTYEGDNSFLLDLNTDPCISGLSIVGQQRMFFKLQFVPKGDPGTLPLDYFEIGLVQYNGENEEMVGACGFQIDNTNGAFNGTPPPPSPVLPGDDDKATTIKGIPQVDWSPQPNPAETGVEIVFNLKTRRYVEIEIYDVLGRKIASKDRAWYKNKRNKVYFDVNDWPTGVYYVHFKYDMYSDAKRLIIQKGN